MAMHGFIVKPRDSLSQAPKGMNSHLGHHTENKNITQKVHFIALCPSQNEFQILRIHNLQSLIK